MSISTSETDKRNYDLAAAIGEAESAFVTSNPESARCAERSRHSLPGGNTRTTLHFNPFPLVIASAKEGTVTDVDGHSYADFVNEYSAGMFGHSSKVIFDAIQQVLGAGINLGGPNRYEADLAERIIARFPSMDRIRFCNTGTEANLLAMGTARAVTGRSKVLVFDGAYHGSLFYFHHGASPINAPIPVVMAQYNDWADTERVITANASDLAAVIVEPMQGASGCIAGELDFLNNLRALCTRNEIVLIFDEVMTSRTSTGGLQKRLCISPDMTTLGKYIGGGITLAAFGGKAEIMNRFDPRSASALPHGGTFNNNVLAMAAGVAAFTHLLTPEAVDRMNSLGDRLRDRLNDFTQHKGIQLQATGVGSLIGLHFHDGPIRRAADLETNPATAKLADDLSRLMHFDMLAAGNYTARRGYMALSLATTSEQVEAISCGIERFLLERAHLIESAFRAAA